MTKQDPEFEFGRDIPFSQNINNSFQFIFTEDGSLFIQVDFDGSKDELDMNIFSYKYDPDDWNEYLSVNKPGKTTVAPFKKGVPITVVLNFKKTSNKKGIIRIYPSLKVLKVDLNKKYEWKYDYQETHKHNIISKLIYEFTNDEEEDLLLEFNYTENFRIKDGLYGYYTHPNPLQIFHKDNPMVPENNTLEIKRGETYKIITFPDTFTFWEESSGTPSYTHFLPAFYFIIKKKKKKVD